MMRGSVKKHEEFFVLPSRVRRYRCQCVRHRASEPSPCLGVVSRGRRAGGCQAARSHAISDMMTSINGRHSLGLLLVSCCVTATATTTTTSSSSSSSSSSTTTSTSTSSRQQAAATPLAGSWFGTMSYPASQPGEWLSHNVPFNLTIDPSGRLASVNWTVEHYPGGGYCSHQQEDGLNVTVDSATGQFFAKGLGDGTKFYSYEATLVGGHTLTSGIIYSANQGVWPGSTRWGNFTATKNGPPPLPGWKCITPPPPPPPGPKLWPLPANFSHGATPTFLASGFGFRCSGGTCGEVLQAAFARTTRLIYAEKDTAVPTGSALLSGLTVTVQNADDSAQALQFGMDESYSLLIPVSGSATLHAPSVWGVL